MTTSKPDVQALIEEAKRVRQELQQGASFHETLGQNAPTAERMRRAASFLNNVAAALSALSGETETEWAVRAKGDSEPWTDVSDDFDWLADNMPGFINEDAEIVRRRKAGEWEVVV